MKENRTVAALCALVVAGGAAFASAPLDEGAWPAVVPEFRTPSPRTVKGAYFRGWLIKSPKENCADGIREFLFRRTVSLKAKPAEAWLQFASIGEGTGVFKVNGDAAAKNCNWMQPTVKEVGEGLKAGVNELDIAYPWRSGKKGVLAELFIRYQDGTSERIDTDSSFRVSGDGGKTWDDVLAQPLPPAKPFHYVRRLGYTDFAHLQCFVSASASPAEVDAGGILSAEFSFAGSVPIVPLDIGIAVARNGGVYWREDVTVGAECVKIGADGVWTMRVPFRVPLYLSEGTFDLAIESGLSCASGAVAKTSFACRRAKSVNGFERRVRADVRDIAGSAQLCIDGKPFFALWGGVRQSHRPDRLPHHSAAPLNVVTVYGYETSGSTCDEWWPSEDGFDPAVFDRQAELYRREYGDGAYFMWDLVLYPPKDWIAGHPDDMCLDDKGERVRDGVSPFSFASKSAIDAMERAVERAVRYLESSPYANRIIGYRINSGHFTEWIGWFPQNGRFTDFSPAAQKGFAEYVKRRCPELGDAHIPTAEERRSPDPAARARCLAYHDFYSRAVADCIIRVMRKARDVAGEGKLLGTYWGYTMTPHSKSDSQMRAHYALKYLLDAKAVDYLMSPQPYQVRRLGDNCGDLKPFASIAANGVVPVIEDDTRTSNGPYNGDNWQVHTLDQTIGVVRRNAGIALCHRTPVFFYALCEGTEFDYPEFAADMAKVRKVGEWCLANETPRNAAVAYVVSEEDIKSSTIPEVKRRAMGFSRQRYNPDGSVKVEDLTYIPGFQDVYQFNYTTLARAGAPVDYVLAEDIASRPNTYKLYIEPDIIAGKIRFRTASGVTEGDTLLKVNDLRERYARAGVHVYCDTDDPVEANGSLFTLHARRAGRKTVTLPKRTTVLDVYNARVVARNEDTFTFDAPLHSSWLFYYGDDAERLLDALNGRCAVAETPWAAVLAKPAPKAYPAPAEVTTKEEGVKGVMLEGEPYRGGPTRFFAWYGLPKGASAERKCPAVVLVHGGMGTAFDRWVKMWNDRGYAAIAMDNCGSIPIRIPKDKVKERAQVWMRHGHSGPAGWGGFGQIGEPLEDQWPYHAVSAVILSHTFLRSLPEVDGGRVGITGISWGGYLTCVAAGVDPRYKWAAPVYGCGLFGDESSRMMPGNMRRADREKWLDIWDASVYLCRARCPFLWVSGTTDGYFKVPMLRKSTELTKGPKFFDIREAMVHGQNAGSAPEEIRSFADHFSFGKPLHPNITDHWAVRGK